MASKRELDQTPNELRNAKPPARKRQKTLAVAKPSYQGLEERLPTDWVEQLASFFQAGGWTLLVERLDACSETVFPPRDETFRAFELTPFDDVDVVVLGQDPYHDDGQAHGLAFSVKEDVKTPPSLRNIFKEIGGPKPPNGNLERWARHGVLLLNTTLTVQAHKANSHRRLGWTTLTDLVIERLNARERPVVFMLWGKAAGKKARLVTNDRHLVLESAHPSPLSAYRGFFGNGHFEAANAFLEANGRETIPWAFTDQADTRDP